MIERRVALLVEEALRRQPAVALLGARQVGKTTLARAMAASRSTVYLDLELPSDRAKLTDPEAYLERYENELVVIDEIHRAPELFAVLRALIDQGRSRGVKTGRFLLLGSASIELLRQSSESLAGRIAFVDMQPLLSLEIDDVLSEQEKLWIRGGFPESFLARDENESFLIRRDLSRTYLRRDVIEFAPRISGDVIDRLWHMLAHEHGECINVSKFAGNLSVSSPTINSYLSLLKDLFLVRLLRPYAGNFGKRLVKSPKVYVRDSGLLHALLNIRSFDEILTHPIVGRSWEGFVIENLLAVTPEGSEAYFYRTARGAEVDLVIEFGSTSRWIVEIKRTRDIKVSRGFTEAQADLQPQKSFVIYGGTERFPLRRDVEACGLRELCYELAQLHRK